jgi:hypothetical protein
LGEAASDSSTDAGTGTDHQANGFHPDLSSVEPIGPWRPDPSSTRSASLEARFAPFDEGLNAFLEILGGEDGILDGRNGVDRGPLSLLEVSWLFRSF